MEFAVSCVNAAVPDRPDQNTTDQGPCINRPFSQKTGTLDPVVLVALWYRTAVRIKPGMLQQLYFFRHKFYLFCGFKDVISDLRNCPPAGPAIDQFPSAQRLVLVNQFNGYVLPDDGARLYLLEPVPQDLLAGTGFKQSDISAV